MKEVASLLLVPFSLLPVPKTKECNLSTFKLAFNNLTPLLLIGSLNVDVKQNLFYLLEL